ncbi:MAG: MSCRAMM family protein [Gemmatimonadaceae bacterium]
MHAIRGVAYDSVAKAPLARAVVQVASADAAGRVFSATTDGSGRYRIDGLSAGRFVIGIDHEAMRALRIDLPLRGFELRDDSLATLDLAIPSGASLHALYCTDSTEQAGDGMLAGFVRDAARNEPLAEAWIVVEWTEVALAPGNMRTVPKHSMARTDPDGTYRACGVPGDVPVGIRVSARGYRALRGKVTVPANGVLRRDFRLADSSVADGPATLSGRVLHENGKVLASGQAAIPALGRDVPVHQGAFTVTGLPLGSWVVEVRSMGLEPTSTIIDVTDSGRVSQTFAIGDKAQPLEAVSVIGKPGKSFRALDELLERRRVGFGTVFLPGNTWLRSANRVTDVFRAARGFSYYMGNPDEVVGRASGGSGCRNIGLYVDGSRWRMTLRDLSDMIPPRDVLAIETYPDVLRAPPQWRTGDVCAVVSILTRQYS